MSEYINNFDINHFIMFSSEAYYSVVREFNRSIWPLQLLIFLMNLGSLGLVLKKRARVVSSWYVACLWTFVSVYFLKNYFSPINWPVLYISYVLIVFGISTGLYGAFFTRFKQEGVSRIIGIGLLATSIILPLNILFTDFSIELIQLFGFGVETSCIGTIGFLLTLRGRLPYILSLVPASWIVLALLIYFN